MIMMEIIKETPPEIVAILTVLFCVISFLGGMMVQAVIALP